MLPSSLSEAGRGLQDSSDETHTGDPDRPLPLMGEGRPSSRAKRGP
jgi:hypothetical protein